MANAPVQTTDTSDEEHFSDASEGKASASSNVPTTRVERVDNQPSHGEVPGTVAHDIRKQDAAPDEVEVVPDMDTMNASPSNTDGGVSLDDQPPVPSTMVEKVDLESRHHGEVPGTAAHEMRKADAEPDVVQEAPEVTREDLEGRYIEAPSSAPRERLTKSASPTTSKHRYSDPRRRSSHMTPNEGVGELDRRAGDDQFARDVISDAIGDDFDDFEQGNEDDDFGAFDEGFQEDEAEAEDINLVGSGTNSHSVTGVTFSNLPNVDFSDIDTLGDIKIACEPFLDELFPDRTSAPPQEQDPSPEVNPDFLTERSSSLWDQLVALPPLQPPNWVRSRIRRLFLVSLGVPVDLDEILPASKQKKLVLPSMETESERYPSIGSEEMRVNGSLTVPKQNEASSTSLNSSTSRNERKRKGPPPPPELDLNSARLLCSTTDTALQNYTSDELRGHVLRLEGLKKRAVELLEYWLVLRDTAISDKEAFEEVIENLVKHAKKIRK